MDMNLSKIQITPLDSNAVTNGKELNYRGVKLLVARAQSTKFLAKFKELSAEHRSNSRVDSIDEKTYEAIMMESMAGTVLVGWQPFVVLDAAEKPVTIEYSDENALNLLRNDPDCRDAVSAFAANIDNYLREGVDSLVGEPAKV